MHTRVVTSSQTLTVSVTNRVVTFCWGNIGRDDPNSKANHEDQWWELHDINTERSYYYNATNHTTEWERPATGDIVQLAKLQVRTPRMFSPSGVLYSRRDHRIFVVSCMTGGSLTSSSCSCVLLVLENARGAR